MIVSADFINISDKDIAAWRGPSCLGTVGITFFSGSVSSLNLELWAFLPFVDYIYCNSDYDSLLDNIPCNIFFRAPSQTSPPALEKKLKEVENLEIKDYKDVS